MSFDIAAFEIIKRELALEKGCQEQDLELVEIITARVNDLLNSDPGLLFSYLYRLDVSEQRVKQVVHHSNDDNAPRALAELILHRQIQRVKTKKTIKQKPIDGWEW